MRRGESGEAQDKVFKRYEFSAKGKFLGRVRIWGASMGFLRVFCGALTTRLCGFCGVSLTWRVLLLFSVDVKCLFRYDRDMADQIQQKLHVVLLFRMIGGQWRVAFPPPMLLRVY